MKMDDLISRQVAIDALWKALYSYEDKTEKQFIESEDLKIEDWMLHRIFVQNMSGIDIKTILDLPSAQPERKKGKWSIEETNTYELSYGVTAYAPVYKCSACGRSIESHLMLDEPIVPEDANFSRFCPSCGADMREEKDNG